MRPNNLGGVTLENLGEVCALREAYEVVSGEIGVRANFLASDLPSVEYVYKNTNSIIDDYSTRRELKLNPEEALYGLFTLRFCTASKATPIGLLLRISEILEGYTHNGGCIPLEVSTCFANVRELENTTFKPPDRREN